MARWLFVIVLLSTCAPVAQVDFGGPTQPPLLPSTIGSANAVLNSAMKSDLSGWTVAPCVTYDATMSHTPDASGSAKGVCTGKTGSFNALSVNAKVSEFTDSSVHVEYWVKTSADFNGFTSVSVWDSTHGGGYAIASPLRCNTDIGPAMPWTKLSCDFLKSKLWHNKDTWRFTFNIVADSTDRKARRPDHAVPLSGTIWIDDMKVQPLYTPLRTFLTYPNYRGYLWEGSAPPPARCNGRTEQMLICGVSELHPSERLPLTSQTLTVRLSPTPGCKSRIVAEYKKPSPTTAEAWTLSGKDLQFDTAYFICSSLTSNGAEVARYPDWKIIPKSSAWRATLRNYVTPEGQLVIAGRARHVWGQYDRPSSYRCMGCLFNSTDEYVAKIAGFGDSCRPLATGSPHPTACSIFPTYQQSHVELIWPFGAIAYPNPDSQLPAYLRALNRYGSNLVQFANNWGSLWSDGAEASAPPAPAVTSLPSGGAIDGTTDRWLHVRITAMEYNAPTIFSAGYRETLASAATSVSLAHVSTNSVRVELPACASERQHGFFVYASQNDETRVHARAGQTQSGQPADVAFTRQGEGTLEVPCGTPSITLTQVRGGPPMPTADTTLGQYRPTAQWRARSDLGDKGMFATMARFMSHKEGAAMIYAADEPLPMMASQVWRLTQNVARWAPDIPVTCTIAQSDSVALWREVCDVIAVDPYGYGVHVNPDDVAARGSAVPRHCTTFTSNNLIASSTFNCSPERTDVWLEEFARDTYGSRPILHVYQQFSTIAALGGFPYARVWEQIMKGVTAVHANHAFGGSVGWGFVSVSGVEAEYYGNKANTRVYDDFQKLSANLKTDIEPYLLTPTLDSTSPGSSLGRILQSISVSRTAIQTCGAGSVYADASRFPYGQIRAVTKQRDDGRQAIFVSNLCGKDNDPRWQVTFALQSKSFHSATVYGENRSLHIVDGRFTDSFGGGATDNGHETRVYLLR